MKPRVPLSDLKQTNKLASAHTAWNPSSSSETLTSLLVTATLASAECLTSRNTCYMTWGFFCFCFFCFKLTLAQLEPWPQLDFLCLRQMRVIICGLGTNVLLCAETKNINAGTVFCVARRFPHLARPKNPLKLQWTCQAGLKPNYRLTLCDETSVSYLSCSLKLYCAQFKLYFTWGVRLVFKSNM